MSHFSPHTTTLAGMQNLQSLWWVNRKQHQTHYQHLTVSILKYPLCFQKMDSRILTNLSANLKFLKCKKKKEKRMCNNSSMEDSLFFFFLRFNVISGLILYLWDAKQSQRAKCFTERNPVPVLAKLVFMKSNISTLWLLSTLTNIPIKTL